MAADVTDVATRLVGGAALAADDVLLAVRIGHQRQAAGLAGLAQVVQAGQLAALALPVPDRILDELERRVLAEVADREHRLEHRLQPLVLAFRGHPVHLQEALVRAALNLDQVRDRNRRLDLREILALAVDVLGKAVHAVKLRLGPRATVVEGWCPTSVRCPTARRTRGRTTDRGWVRTQPPSRHGLTYLISTLAPASSNFFLIASASSLVTPSLIGLGALSTRSLASLSPRLVTSRTDLDHVDLVAADVGQHGRELGLLFDDRRRRRRRRPSASPSSAWRPQPTRRVRLPASSRAARAPSR